MSLSIISSLLLEHTYYQYSLPGFLYATGQIHKIKENTKDFLLMLGKVSYCDNPKVKEKHTGHNECLY